MCPEPHDLVAPNFRMVDAGDVCAETKSRSRARPGVLDHLPMKMQFDVCWTFVGALKLPKRPRDVTFFGFGMPGYVGAILGAKRVNGVVIQVLDSS